MGQTAAIKAVKATVEIALPYTFGRIHNANFFFFPSHSQIEYDTDFMYDTLQIESEFNGESIVPTEHKKHKHKYVLLNDLLRDFDNLFLLIPCFCPFLLALIKY